MANPGPFGIPGCYNGNCVAVTDADDSIVFTSTVGPGRGAVRYDADEVSAFILDVKAGKYDRYIVDKTPGQSGAIVDGNLLAMGALAGLTR